MNKAMKTGIINMTYRLGVCLLLTIGLTACDKVPANGNLDGMWQLMSVETPDSISPKQAERLYLSFQLGMTYWTRQGKGERFFSHFTHTRDSIIFYDLCFPAQHSFADPDDHLVSPDTIRAGVLDIWGIHTADMRYAVQTLTSGNLVLEKADTLLRFRKF